MVWYDKAMPSLTGLMKIKIEKRMAEAEATIPRNIVDLLKIADPEKGAISGKWKFENGTLVADNSNVGILQLSYCPPEEYDLTTEFSGTKGLLTWILLGRGNQFEYCMGYNDGGNYAGFEIIDGKYANANDTTRAFSFVPKKKYQTIIKVRKNKVSVFVDGKLLTELITNYQNLSLHPNWAIPNKQVLSIGSFRSTNIYYAITVKEISGPGTQLSKDK